MEMTQAKTISPAEPDRDFGKSPESMSATLRASKLTSELFDTPLRPPPPPRFLPRYWMTRMYVALSIMANCIVAYLEPQSLTAMVLRTNPTGWACLGILFALAVTALVDVAINDLLPQGYYLRWTRDQRHWIYVLMALFTMGLTYAIVREKGFTALLLAYWVDAAIAVAIAPLDLFARHRGH